MRQFKLVVAMLMTSVLAGCGGSGSNQAPKINFSSQVSFGDSLSDVGSYAVGTTIPAMGGGQYTINGTGKNWAALMAAQFGLPAPCAAQTGLSGFVASGFNAPVTNHPGCTGYAQGGARVTNPVGTGNALLGGANAILGQLTVPVVTQIQNHLATVGGSFKGDEIVLVMAGANDVLIQLGAVGQGLSSASAVAAVGTAATDLVTDINTQITGKGAKYVVVVNVPDIAGTPKFSAAAQSAKDLINQMVTTFNSLLLAGVSSNANVLYVDAYTVSHDQVTNPAPYGLTNVTLTACNITDTTKNPLGSSLICNANNLNAGVVDHYLFADDIHPTPYGYWLLARLVSKEMLTKGWL